MSTQCSCHYWGCVVYSITPKSKFMLFFFVIYHISCGTVFYCNGLPRNLHGFCIVLYDALFLTPNLSLCFFCLCIHNLTWTTVMHIITAGVSASLSVINKSKHLFLCEVMWMWLGIALRHIFLIKLSWCFERCPTLFHGNSYIFYEVANFYEFVPPHSYDLVWFL